MRIFLFAFLFLYTSLLLRAQRSNFVYIQSEPARLFSLIIKGDTLTSSKTGYLILSKLTDSAYQIAISFKEQTWPTQYFTLGVFQTDQGYLLKDYGDKVGDYWTGVVYVYNMGKIINQIPTNLT